MRRGLLAVLFLAILATGVELLLLGHTESAWQWVPLALLGLGLAVLLWRAVDRRAVSLRVFQGTMCAYVLSGAMGIVLHCLGKMEFKSESDPSLTGLLLFWEAMKSKSPPALALGIMVQMGLLGLIYTFRHPALAASPGKREPQVTGEKR